MSTKKEVIKKKILPFSLAAVIASSSFTFTGCSNKDDIDDVTYTIEKTDEQIQNDKESYLEENVDFFEHVQNDSEEEMKCVYYIDLNNSRLKNSPDASMIAKTHLEKYNFDVDNTLYNEGFYNKDFVYPIRHINYTNGMDFLKLDNTHLSYKKYLSKNLVTIPTEYKWIWNKKCNYDSNSRYFKVNISYTELCGTTGYRYLLYKCIITTNKAKAPNNISNEYIAKFGEQKGLKKGAKIKYNALFKIEYDNKLTLIADKQTGFGSKDDNVLDNVLNNYDDVFKPISSIVSNDNGYYYDTDTFYKDVYKDNVIIREKKRY